MNILLATYSFYPYSFGGTEVYVSGLAYFLMGQGHRVHIIAGMPPQAFNEHPIFYEDDQLKTIQYSNSGVYVTGVILKDETTGEIYKKYRPDWVNSWQAVLNKISMEPWDIIHLHAHTSATGEALLRAVKNHSPVIKVMASYHVPISCVKGTLLIGNSMKACNVKPAVAICTACFISSKQHWSLSFSKTITALMPPLHNEQLPTTIRLKYLVKQFIDSFAAFNYLVNGWHVFSEQVKAILRLNGIEENKIFLLRHGVNPVFYKEKIKEEDERINKKPVIFLYPSRAEKLKGFLTLLKAWCSLPERADSQLWITGENQSNDKDIKTWIAVASARQDIKWIGVKTQEELAGIMSVVHCSLIPSEWLEIGPLVFHEAIAAGSNVIASDMGGCKELSVIYPTGSTLFEAGSPGSLAEKINAFIYKSPAEKPANSLENYKQVLNSYTSHTADHKINN